MMQRSQSESMPQHLRLLRASSHHDCHIIGFDNRVEYAGGEVATRADSEHPAFEKSHNEREKATVQQDISGLLIQRAELAMSIVADHMIDIGSDQVAIALAAEFGDNLQSLLEVVVIKVQNASHAFEIIPARGTSSVRAGAPNGKGFKPEWLPRVARALILSLETGNGIAQR